MLSHLSYNNPIASKQPRKIVLCDESGMLAPNRFWQCHYNVTANYTNCFHAFLFGTYPPYPEAESSDDDKKPPHIQFIDYAIKLPEQEQLKQNRKVWDHIATHFHGMCCWKDKKKRTLRIGISRR